MKRNVRCAVFRLTERVCGMTINELIEMTENNARYIRKFPDILLPIEEIERIIGINARRVLFNTHAC